LKTVDITKWVATVIQLIGYGLTGMGITPLNIYFFIVGIFLWFITGYLWRDKAIMVVHIGALISILSGLFFLQIKRLSNQLEKLHS